MVLVEGLVARWRSGFARAGAGRFRQRRDSMSILMRSTTSPRKLSGWRVERSYRRETSTWRVSYNLHAAMRLLALPGGLKSKRLKAIRFALIDAPARRLEPLPSPKRALTRLHQRLCHRRWRIEGLLERLT